MIRKIIGFTGIIMGVVSFVMMTLLGPVSLWNWILGSFSVYLFLAGVFIYFKRRMLQVMLIPFLLYYAIGGFVFLPLQVEYSFGIVGSALMMVMIFYILFSRLASLRILRTSLGLLIGVALFTVFQYAVRTLPSERAEIAFVQERESAMFFN